MRLGSPAATTRGLREAEFRQVGRWIIEVVDSLRATQGQGDPATEARIAHEVQALCSRFPIYQEM
ncbi:Serine hydroxymethyltransferase [Rubellimicrobium mesophilum DSM 19309]|uniref:Serine hydroxymethyltransferase n=1 Tax=Rubellimicrobium mesophilum DSM 19309 TaxID=442562 RepID=A0A017HM04_9RHOB|nr:Serine hydroxymethyltransferase [Rubellimicrobium mesophilum DSM 19309]